MFFVGDQKRDDEIKEAVQVYPFAGKLVLLTPKEIEKDFNNLGNFRQRSL